MIYLNQMKTYKDYIIEADDSNIENWTKKYYINNYVNDLNACIYKILSSNSSNFLGNTPEKRHNELFNKLFIDRFDLLFSHLKKIKPTNIDIKNEVEERIGKIIEYFQFLENKQGFDTNYKGKKASIYFRWILTDKRLNSIKYTFAESLYHLAMENKLVDICNYAKFSISQYKNFNSKNMSAANFANFNKR